MTPLTCGWRGSEIVCCKWTKSSLAGLLFPARQRSNSHRTIRKRKVCKIVEIGIGGGQRALRMISLAQCFQSAADVRYTGIDWFEAGLTADGRGADAEIGLSHAPRHRRLDSFRP